MNYGRFHMRNNVSPAILILYLTIYNMDDFLVEVKLQRAFIFITSVSQKLSDKGILESHLNRLPYV